jgi:biotin transport system substrate-specific component
MLIASRPLVLDTLVRIPQRRLRVLLQLLLGVLFLTLAAQLRWQIGPVPITGQTLAVLLLGAAGGRYLGTAAVASYLALGLLGLPLFAGWAGGWAVLSGATAGYLIGFLPAAYLVGAAAERFGTTRPLRLLAPMLLGSLLIYLFGVLGLLRFAPDVATAVAWGVTPFVLGDALKVAAAALLWPRLARGLGGR